MENIFCKKGSFDEKSRIFYGVKFKNSKTNKVPAQNMVTMTNVFC